MADGITLQEIDTSLRTQLQNVIDQSESLDPIPTTLTLGTSIYPITRYSMLENFEMDGRTLVNLLGRDGNCEDTSKFDVAGGTLALDATTLKMGYNSIKFTSTVSSGFGQIRLLTYPNVSDTKYYLVAAWIKNTSVSNPLVRIITTDGLTQKKAGGAVTGVNWALAYVTIAPSDITGLTAFRVDAIGSLSATGQIFNVDGFSLYEITSAEKTYIDSLSTAEAQAYIAQKYPYVDSVQSIRNPYAIAEGRNLLGTSISDWENIPAGAGFNGEYYYKSNNTSLNFIQKIPVVANQTYTLSATAYSVGATSVKVIYGAWKDENGGDIFPVITLDADGVSTPTFLSGTATAPSNATEIWVYPIAQNVDAFVYFKDVMLNVGSTALPFEPQNRSLVAWLDTFRSNVGGTVVDKLYYDGDGNARKVSWWEYIELDETITWTYSADFTGYKRVYASAPNGVTASDITTKYDGKVLDYGRSDFAFTTSDQSRLGSDGNIHLSIADTDSGWGESYTPTADEIKVYFMGWKMNTGVFGTPYNGTGTKTWVKWSATDNTGSVTAVPTTPSADITGGVYDYYKLQYQLATPIDVPVQTEGDVLSVFDGDNQITLGEGIVVREAANPLSGGDGFYYINASTVSGTELDYRTKTIHELYRDNVEDLLWTLSTANAYGNERRYIKHTDYDEESAYSVTYFVLDAYKYGIAPQTITASYEANLNEVTAKLTERYVDLQSSVDVLENSTVRATDDILDNILAARNNTSYTTKQIRNVTLSTSDPSGGGNGDIWIKYTP